MRKNLLISSVLLLSALYVSPQQVLSRDNHCCVITEQKSCVSDKITQADIELIKSTTWTDGFEFVKLIDPKEAKRAWGVEVKGDNALIFIGGTLHEGGAQIILRLDAGSVTTDKDIEYQMFPAGDKVSFDKKNMLLMFRDASDGTLHGVLKPLLNKGGLKEMTVNNLRRLLLAGIYKDNNGKEYKFSVEENRIECPSSESLKYEFAVSYDLPQPIMLLSGKAYEIHNTPQGIDFYPMVSSDEEDFYKPIANAEKISLTRMKPERGNYPLLSSEYFTIPEIMTYAGDISSGLEEFDYEKELKRQVSILEIMRNEILARHGFIFKSKEWNDYFGRNKWYEPAKKDVSSELSDIEKMNIELITWQEKHLKELLKDMF